MFSEVLGIRPWETDLLTLAEFEALTQYIDDRNERMEGD